LGFDVPGQQRLDLLNRLRGREFPSVLIIDTSGTIRFVYSNPDYKIRLGADALWAAAQPLATVK
jgi:hypothetical protein